MDAFSAAIRTGGAGRSKLLPSLQRMRNVRRISGAHSVSSLGYTCVNFRISLLVSPLSPPFPCSSLKSTSYIRLICIYAVREQALQKHTCLVLLRVYSFFFFLKSKTARKMRCDIIFTAPCHTADADLQHSGPEPRAPRVLMTVDTCSASLWPATPCPSYTPVYTATQTSENQPYGLPNLLSQTAQIWAT